MLSMYPAHHRVMPKNRAKFFLSKSLQSFKGYRNTVKIYVPSQTLTLT